ncbi:MAG TPA: phosphoribosylanthranilate isomerase [Gemmatimonadales bacterium]
MPLVKFCGLTRAEDAAVAAGLGAVYAGVIFAGGPRLLTAERAAGVLEPLPPAVRRVGVFGAQRPDEIAAIVARAGLDVVQLHATRSMEELAAVRRTVPARIELWAVARVEGGALGSDQMALATMADALVVDALVPGQLGGTGVATDWEALAGALRRIGRPGKFVLAGGLRPENVARAAALLQPDVLDVSSGVESSPGVKDHERMTAFARAARAPQPATQHQA